MLKFRDLKFFEKLGDASFTRKGFLKLLTGVLGTLAVTGGSQRRGLLYAATKLEPRTQRPVKTACDLAVAKGTDPAAITRKAVDALGGMKLFVKPGDVVVVKPNIGWDRTPEQAGNTNPQVAAELVKMCREAGAKTVKVFDYTCNDCRRTYENSGIAAACRAAGAQVFFVSDWKFSPAAMAAGDVMNEWPVFRDAVECDCFINVPVAKHHGLSGLTLSMKNLMGVCGGSRGSMHRDIGRKLAEMTRFIKPDLTVIDAYRMLMRNGPTGGSLSDVEQRNTVIAGRDPVLSDAYAATLFGKQPQDISYISYGAQMGLGSMDLKKASIKTVQG